MSFHKEKDVVGGNPTTLYESEHIIAVYKPPGLIVHSDGKTNEPTLVEWLIHKYPEIEGIGEEQYSSDGSALERHGIVHRLDRDTSGVMVVARTHEGFVHLKKQFQDRTIEKEYLAFVYGVIKDDTGVIDRPIGRSKKDFRIWSAQRGARGKLRDACTKYTVLHRGTEATYLSLEPKTGRTHQIRAHLKAIHHPVVCDLLYAPNHTCILGFHRLALHALSITFSLLDGTVVTIEADTPLDFCEALKHFTEIES